MAFTQFTELVGKCNLFSACLAKARGQGSHKKKRKEVLCVDAGVENKQLHKNITTGNLI